MNARDIEQELAKTSIWTLLFLSRESIASWIALQFQKFWTNPDVQKFSSFALRAAQRMSSSAKKAIGAMSVALAVELLLAFMFGDHTSIFLFGLQVAMAVFIIAKIVLIVNIAKIHLATEVSYAAFHQFSNAAEALARTTPDFLGLARGWVGQRKNEKMWGLYGTPYRMVVYFSLAEFALTLVLCTLYQAHSRPIIVMTMIDFYLMAACLINGFKVAPERALGFFFKSLAVTAAACLVYLLSYGAVSRMWHQHQLTSERQKKADRNMELIRRAADELEREKAEQAIKSLRIVQAEIDQLESKSDRPTTVDKNRLSYLYEVKAWYLKGGKGPKPQVKIPNCRDDQDNNGDGFKDRADFNCYRLDPACGKREKDCRNVFRGVNSGQPLGAYYRYDPDLDETHRAPPAILPKPEEPPAIQTATAADLAAEAERRQKTQERERLLEEIRKRGEEVKQLLGDPAN